MNQQHAMTLDSITASKWELSNRLTTFCSLPLLATPCESVIDSCSATSPLCDRLLAFHDLWHAAVFLYVFHKHSGHWNTRKIKEAKITNYCSTLHQTHAQWNPTRCSRQISFEQVSLPSISFSSLNVAKAAKAYSILFLQPPQLMLGPMVPSFV